jgi:hypothetical protein
MESGPILRVWMNIRIVKIACYLMAFLEKTLVRVRKAGSTAHMDEDLQCFLLSLIVLSI